MAFFFCGLFSGMVIRTSSVVTSSIWRAFSLPLSEGGASTATRNDMRFAYIV
ncbi:Uncharacterized protein DAT39_005044 [Clarias magur]|uniref:Uncharacterized protein n=1 Tax=Clarias magur TaxID=1594786 RepID=A0A8J4X607_CLAMG|nr:Uncharacterized protein DAT39_005044 [Clarias magur]